MYDFRDDDRPVPITGERHGEVAKAFYAWLYGGKSAVAPWDNRVLASSPKSMFPGGSRQRVNRAGENVRASVASEDDLAVIDIWRAAHRSVLNTFQSILRNRTRKKKIVVGQRHKRKNTIFNKLLRFQRMQLGRMDDVAGCRIIFENTKELYEFRKKLHAARFNHELKNELDKYDYIKKPKETGYRGVHDVYSYDANSPEGRAYKGLLIELQYRTIYQHAWATTVEVVGFVTENQPKFQQGDERYERILRLASEIIARAHEKSKSSLPSLSDEDVVKDFIELDEELSFMGMLRGLNAADKEISEQKNFILIMGKESVDDLEIRTYRDAPEALRALFELEREAKGKDIVLVRADSTEDVRIAFKNYFSDAREFITLIDSGCKKLVGGKVLKGGRKAERKRNEPRAKRTS